VLKLLHGLMVQAMKAKQTVNLKHVVTLRKLIDEFEEVYAGKSVPVPHKH